MGVDLVGVDFVRINLVDPTRLFGQVTRERRFGVSQRTTVDIVV